IGVEPASCGQWSVKAMLPHWHCPEISMQIPWAGKEGGKGLRMACKRIAGTAVDDPPAAAGSAPIRQVRYHFALCGRDPAVILPWICRNANQGFCAYV
ncbi:MAG: hypothetical protein ACK5JI_04255, partial [Azonexus sp.]